MADTPDQLEMIRALLARENPDAQSAVIQPMGAVGRVLSGGAKGTTDPLSGKIAVNMNAVSSPQDLEDTVRHELVHEGQIKKMTPMDKAMTVPTGIKNTLGLGVPYGQNPLEMEAYGVENDARIKKGLSQNPTPSFTDTRTWIQRTLPTALGGKEMPWNANQDIQLPSSRLEAAQRQRLMEQELLRRQVGINGKQASD